LKQYKSPFKWHFEPSIILLCVHWHRKYQLSYRDLEEMMSTATHFGDQWLRRIFMTAVWGRALKAPLCDFRE
jgi:hypothetical protein